MNHHIRTSTNSIVKGRKSHHHVKQVERSLETRWRNSPTTRRQSFASTSVLTCSSTLEIGSPASSTSCLIGMVVNSVTINTIPINTCSCNFIVTSPCEHDYFPCKNYSQLVPKLICNQIVG